MTPASVRSCFFAPEVTNSFTVILVDGFSNDRDSTDGLVAGTLSLAVNTFGLRVAILGVPLILTFSNTLPAYAGRVAMISSSLISSSVHSVATTVLRWIARRGARSLPVEVAGRRMTLGLIFFAKSRAICR